MKRCSTLEFFRRLPSLPQVPSTPIPRAIRTPCISRLKRFARTKRISASKHFFDPRRFFHLIHSTCQFVRAQLFLHSIFLPSLHFSSQVFRQARGSFALS